VQAIAAINGWALFRIITVPVSVVLAIATATADLTTGAGVAAMVQLSVRFAVPLLYLVFAASSLLVLFPGPFSRWLLRNRKYLGLAFAVAMAWQAVFILWLVIGYTDYYVNEIYVLRDVIEGVGGYAFLLAMTVTSFPQTRKRLRPRQWRLLHLSGIYFLWAYAFSTYWWALYYYGNPVLLDYVFYWSGLAAWTLRAAAWGKKRLKAAAGTDAPGSLRLASRFAGLALLAAGLAVAAFGSAWQRTAADVLYGYTLTRLPELYLPFWPFEPFLPLAVMLGGIYLLSRFPGRPALPQATRAPRSPQETPAR
jgi:sulfoxide reductase heme-binding subunit YedZ